MSVRLTRLAGTLASTPQDTLVTTRLPRGGATAGQLILLVVVLCSLGWMTGGSGDQSEDSWLVVQREKGGTEGRGRVIIVTSHSLTHFPL